MTNSLLQNSQPMQDYYFNMYWNDLQDPRTKNFPLVDGPPYLVLFIMSFYLYFALSLGPKLMEHRSPFDSLKPLITVFNFSMAASNAYFTYLVVINCDYGRRFLVWHYPDRSDTSSQTLWELNMCWWYWMTKFLDLLDTVFFVLRKKFDHLTFLHLYHHTMVPIFGCLCMKCNANAPFFGFFALLNGIVHTCMYTYFGLSSLGPTMRPYLWWKRYLTLLQLCQFVALGTYAVAFYFNQSGYPSIIFWIAMTQPPFFFRLFYDYYRKTYCCINNENNQQQKKLK